MAMTIPTEKEIRAMTLAQLSKAKKALDLELKKLKARVDKLKALSELARELEDVPEFKTINEFLKETRTNITAGQKTSLGYRLQKGASVMKWGQGHRTVAMNTKARSARQPTYPPDIIASVLRDLKAGR